MTTEMQEDKVDTAPNDAFICYGLKPPAEEPDVGTLYTHDDPADPVFYSTCYTLQKVTRLKDQPAPPSTQSSASSNQTKTWHFGNQCISCEQAKYNSELAGNIVAQWDLIDDCKKCK